MISNSSFEEIRKKANEVRNIELSALLQHFGSTKDLQDKAEWHSRCDICKWSEIHELDTVNRWRWRH